MAQVINTNMASLNAQRNLSTSQSQLQVSLQRLSSGLRINSAKDDAAGMAISSRMTSQINGLNQAARNANDGISLAQTAEGSLNAISDNLQRMRELAVQSANATNSASDRATLQNEVSQLASEIDRVAAGAEFNGVKLLDGSFSAQTFQVGANATANDRITVDSISSARTVAMGQSYGATVATGTLTASTGITAATQFTIAVNGGTAVDVFSASGGAAIAGSAKDLATAINASNITGITATANATSAAGTYGATGAVTDGNLTLTINSIAITVGVTNAGIGTANVDAAEAAITANSAATGVTVTRSGNALTLVGADGRNIDFVFGGGTTGIVAQDVGLGTVAATTWSSYDLNYAGTGGVVVGGSALVGVKGVTSGATASAATGVAVSAVDISTVDGANAALASLDSALATVNTSRASLGAFQNRFMSAVSNLQTTAENLTASRSRIQDADFAVETAAMTRGQILQQAGTAILAQANSLPNSVLSLLK